MHRPLKGTIKRHGSFCPPGRTILAYMSGRAMHEQYLWTGEGLLLVHQRRLSDLLSILSNVYIMRCND